MSEPDLTSLTLDELTDLFQERQRILATATRTTLEAAIAAGEVLREARSRIEYGHWTTWLRDQAGIDRHVANTYIRLAENQQALPADRDLGVRDALTFLRGVVSANGRAPRNRTPDTVKGQIRRLEGLGLERKEIAKLVGVSRETVYSTLDRDYARKRAAIKRENARRRDQERRALVEMEKRVERAALARNAGGLVERAYGEVRRLCDALDKALAQAEPQQAHDLREALRLAHKAEDAIVVALKQARSAA